MEGLNMLKQSSFLLDEWITQYRSYTAHGKCADFIPALSHADPTNLGICIIGTEGFILKSGNWNTPFTIQSISKVISFIVACMANGIDKVLEKVDLEPTGDAFNSIVRLESNKTGKPFNPFINAGAITVASLLPGTNPNEKLEAVMSFLEKLLGKRLIINEEVYQSESETAYRNRSLAYYLKEKGYLGCLVEDALETYFKQCAIEVDTECLAMISLIIANNGYHPFRHEQIFPKEIAKMAKAVMLTCGMYNTSGKFAAFVGVPAKSGSSGGIIAAIPPKKSSMGIFNEGCGIGIYGPSIDEHANSVAGVMLLRHIVNEWDLNIF
jgi:glutaminase